MAEDTREFKPEAVDAALEEMKLEGESPPGDTIVANGYDEVPTPGKSEKSRSSTPATKKSASRSPYPKQSASQSPKSEDEDGEEHIGGDITVTVEPGKAPKLLRTSSQKIIARPPQLFSDLPDSTEESLDVFHLIKDCIYGAKHFGASDNDALDCDCSEEWSELSQSHNIIVY